MTDTEEKTSTKKPFWEKHGFVIMAVVGIVVAGGVSFWMSHGSGRVPPAPGFTQAALSQRPKGPVLVLDAGSVMADAIKYAQTIHMSTPEAQAFGRTVGGVIEAASQKYADEGYVVISRGIMAAPPADNITPEVARIVLAKLKAQYGAHP